MAIGDCNPAPGGESLRVALEWLRIAKAGPFLNAPRSPERRRQIYSPGPAHPRRACRLLDNEIQSRRLQPDSDWPATPRVCGRLPKRPLSDESGIHIFQSADLHQWKALVRICHGRVTPTP